MSRLDENEDFVQEMDDDSYEDDFEKKVNEKIELHKKDLEERESNRPESKYNRPESSKIQISNKLKKEEAPDSFQLQQQQDLALQQKELLALQLEMQDSSVPCDLQEQQITALGRFQSFIQIHMIEVDSFWKSNRMYIPVDQLRQYITNINYQADEEEIDVLLTVLANADDLVTIQTLCKHVPTWNHKGNQTQELFKERTNIMASESKKKFQQGRALSAKQKVQKEKAMRMKELSLLNPPELLFEKLPVSNKSNEYLRLHRKKQEEKTRVLKSTISRGKNEQEYDCLIKMGEANELLQKMNSETNYRAYKAEDVLRVHVFEQQGYVQEMTVDEFNRVYNNLKNQYLKTQKIKPWDLGSKKAGDRLNTAPTDNKTTGVKKEKQVELRKVLLETMMLTNVLKDQLELLTRKNINGFNQTDNSHRHTH